MIYSIIKHTFIILLFLPLLISCGKKEISCAEIHCLNDGICLDGSCNCPDGFTGQNCETDLCDLVTCDGTKTCLNGDCICPRGYTGNECSKEILPSSVRIDEIIIIEFPSTMEDGSVWDDAGGPDLAVAVYNEAQEQLFFSEIKQDVDPSEIQTYRCNFILTSMILNEYVIPLTEWDDDKYVLVGQWNLTLYHEGMGFPDTVEVYTSDTTQLNLRAKVTLSYGF